MACFEIMAVDDDVIERDDRAYAFITADNPNDRVLNASTLIIIIDNDSKLYLYLPLSIPVCLCVTAQWLNLWHQMIYWR